MRPCAEFAIGRSLDAGIEPQPAFVAPTFRLAFRNQVDARLKASATCTKF
jgi:hypothetical protein